MAAGLGSLGSLVVTLAADTARFQGDLGKAAGIAERRMRDIRNTVRRGFASFAQYSAIAATAIGTATATIVRSQAQQIDELAKTAEFIGISVEALQELRYAADLSGISSAGLDDSLRRLGRRAGEFANSGAGPAQKAFEALGISVRDTSGQVKSTESIFDEAVAALQNVGSTAERSAYLAQLFGDDFGPKLVPLINKGTAGIAEMRAEVAALGGVITGTQAAGVERMNDAMTSAQTAISGAAQQFTAALAPAIAGIAERFVESAKESRGFQSAAMDAGENASTAVGWVADAIEGVQRTFQVWGRSLTVTFAAMELGVYQLANSIINGPTAAMNALLGLASQVTGINLGEIPQLNASKLLEQGMARAASVVREGMGDINEILMAPMPSVGIEESIARVRRELENARPRNKGGTGGLEEDAATAAAAFSALKSSIDSDMAEIDRIFNDRFQFDQAFEEAKAQSESATRSMVDDLSGLKSFADQAARNMQDSLAGFFRSGMSDAKSFASGIIDTFRDIASQIAANAVLQSIFGGFAGKGGFLGGIADSILGRASGGPVTGGTPYIVGERGPELFVPGRSGGIVPNHALGGGGVTVNVYPQNNERPGELLALVPVIQMQIEQSMELKRRRGY